MAVKVFFIAKIKDLNEEYQDYSKRVRALAETNPGFISIESEEIGDVEITISTWKTKAHVHEWAYHPLHQEAKARAGEWYEWVKGYHVQTDNT
jgi:heme-degrading monooxygenase HmoA